MGSVGFMYLHICMAYVTYIYRIKVTDLRGIGTNIESVKGEKVRLKMMEIHIDDIFNNLKKNNH